MEAGRGLVLTGVELASALGSSLFQTSDLQRSRRVTSSLPGGPALIYVLEPDSVEVPDGGPPKALTITHQVPEMDPHVFPYGGRLHVHEGHVPLDKSKALIDSYTDGCPSGVYTYS